MDAYRRPVTDFPRVLFVVGANGTGGTELQLRALIAELPRRGVSVQVVLLDGGHGVCGLPVDTRVIAHERPSTIRSLLTYVRAVREVRSLLRSGEFDVVHGVHARGYAVAAAASVGLRDVRRVAWRRNLGIHLVGRKALAMGLLERAMLGATDVVLANSVDVRDYWVDRHGLAADKVLVVPNLLQDWRFDVERAPASEPLTIVAVGGLRPVKGHEVLLRAVSGLDRKDIKVVILGDGERRSALAEQARELGVDVGMPGVQTDPRPWLAGATLYVHPSLSEGASNAVLEAMAAGVPIVASDVGGMRELLGETGVLVPPGDEVSLREAIRRLLEAPALCQDLGAAARTRARERCSVDVVVQTTIRVYRGELPCAES